MNTIDPTAALKACRAHLDQTAAFLLGTAPLPDDTNIIGARFHDACLHARPLAKGEEWDVLGADTPAIVASILHQTTGPHARYFGPSYFAGMRLMELVGRFLFVPSRHGVYYYVIFAGPKNKKVIHHVTRLIANPPASANVLHVLPKQRHGYRFYLPDLFKITAKRKVREDGQETRALSLVREDALRFAVKLFAEQANEAGKWPGLDITTAEFEHLLRSAFSIADARQVRTLPAQGQGLRAGKVP